MGNVVVQICRRGPDTGDPTIIIWRNQTTCGDRIWLVPKSMRHRSGPSQMRQFFGAVCRQSNVKCFVVPAFPYAQVSVWLMFPLEGDCSVCMHFFFWAAHKPQRVQAVA